METTNNREDTQQKKPKTTDSAEPKKKKNKKWSKEKKRIYKKIGLYVAIPLIILIVVLANFAYNKSTATTFEKFVNNNQVRSIEYKEAKNTIVYKLTPKARKAEVAKAKKKGTVAALKKRSGLYEVQVIKNYFSINKDVYKKIKTNDTKFKVSGSSTPTWMRVVQLFFIIIVITNTVKQIKDYKKGKLSVEKEDSMDLSFDDIGGLHEVKAEMKRLIFYLNNRKTVAEYVDKIPKGVLFEGAPGNGKTMLAKVIASESDTPFFYVSSSEIEGSFVAEGSRKVKKIFSKVREEIKTSGSAILFLDELDAVGVKRESRSVAETNQTLNQLLIELDGFKEEDNLLIIGATNLASQLDSALIRSGRFDRIIKIQNPGLEDREEILNLYIDKKKEKFDDSVFESDFIHMLSLQTSGFSSSDLSRLITDSLLLAMEDADKVKNIHLRKAYLQIVMGLPRTTKVDDESRKIVAYHEAGHAIVSMATSPLGHDSIAYGTIRPYGETGGHISYIESNRTLRRKSDYLNTVRVLLAGRAVENILLNGDFTNGASGDLQHAHRYLTEYVSKVGMSDTVQNYYSPKEDTKFVEEEVSRLVQELTVDVNTIVREKFEEITELAEFLLEKQDLEREDIVRMYSQKYPRKEVLAL